MKFIMKSEDIEWNWTLLSQCRCNGTTAGSCKSLGYYKGIFYLAAWLEAYKAAAKNTTIKTYLFAKASKGESPDCHSE